MVMWKNTMIPKCLMEGLGVAMLTYCALGSSLGSVGNLTTLSIGLVLAILIYIGGNVSGGHFNPAVTMGLLISDNTNAQTMIYYILSQLVGGLMGVLMLFIVVLASGGLTDDDLCEHWQLGQFCHDRDNGDRTRAKLYVGGLAAAALVDFFWSFFLVFTVHHVACPAAAAKNSYYGLAIGGVVAASGIQKAFRLGPFMNPAVALGWAVLNSVKGEEGPENAFIVPIAFVFAEFVGGIVAGLIYKFVTNPDEIAKSESA